MDPRIEIKEFALKEEQAAKAWFGSNWVPLGVGALLGMLAELLIHRL